MKSTIKILNMTILDLLKRACKTKGVPEKYAERIEKASNVTKAEDVESAVDSFKENILPVIQEAETSATAEYENKYGLKDGKPVKTPEPKKDPEPVKVDGLSPEITKLIEAQNKQIEDLKGLVHSSVKSVASADKTAAAKRLLAEKKLPEGWLNRIQAESEISIEDQVKALNDEYVSIQQGVINEAVESGKYAPGFQQPKERSEEEWTKLMNEDSKSGNPGVVDLGIK